MPTLTSSSPVPGAPTESTPSRRAALLGLGTAGSALLTGATISPAAAVGEGRDGSKGAKKAAKKADQIRKAKLAKKKAQKKAAQAKKAAQQAAKKATATPTPTPSPTAAPSPSAAPSPTTTTPPTSASAPTPTRAATSTRRASPTRSASPSTSPSPSPTSGPTPDGCVLPDPHTRQVLSRFSYGMTPALLTEVESLGGADAWFEAQLNPAQIPDGYGEDLVNWFPSLSVDPITQYAKARDGSQPGLNTMVDFVRWTLLRRVGSSRQLAERMAEFWTNSIYIPALETGAFGYRFEYDRVIRKHALGRFSDLLQEAIVHPAMGAFLDNGVSTKWAVNENLGRELLELHTVGRGNFTEDDVLNSARILTGYRIDSWGTWEATYDPESHWTGTVTVGNFTHPNTDPDGRAVVAAYLSYLAKHPATARRIAYRLAQFFVSDQPPEALVARLSEAYLANDTAIIPVLRVLVSSPEFDQAVLAKVTSPANDVVKAFRSLAVKIVQDPHEESGMNTIIWLASEAGMIPMKWPRPDGEPLDGSAYSSVGRVLGSFEQHVNIAFGLWPSIGTTYRANADWLPRPSLRFDEFVTHLCHTVLFVEPPAGLIDQCALAAGLTPDTVLSADHGFVKWHLPRVLMLLLNSPFHMNH